LKGGVGRKILSFVMFLITNIMISEFKMQDINKKNERVIVYIDGFNLYFGMREANLDNCRWLNIKKMILKLIQPHQELVEIKYFISRVSNSPDKQKRQSTSTLMH